jgi:hypothetical protein
MPYDCGIIHNLGKLDWMIQLQAEKLLGHGGTQTHNALINAWPSKLQGQVIRVD